VNSRSGKTGFTLVEILIAVAIITAIIAMVYGSYFAASKSARACKIRIALSQESRAVLEQMAKQIRCCYAGSAKGSKYPESKVPQLRTTPESIKSYFNGSSGEMGGEILNLVTTSGISEENVEEDGLFEVAYKFEKNSGTLSFSRERFVDTANSYIEKRNWQSLSENIESIELAFFDGRQWLQSWDFKEKRELPLAVKINITCEDENHRQYFYGTTAYVCCRKKEGEKTISETLVSMNK
jgi:prepilin-type N-terminal cleavage/methylation domain-containing protein